VYEVDGNKVREHDARLEKLFREAPDGRGAGQRFPA
jgi:hypothetical protein